MLVPLIALSKRDFGSMAKFETYALENGPTAAELEADKSIVQSENANKATPYYTRRGVGPKSCCTIIIIPGLPRKRLGNVSCGNY